MTKLKIQRIFKAIRNYKGQFYNNIYFFFEHFKQFFQSPYLMIYIICILCQPSLFVVWSFFFSFYYLILSLHMPSNFLSSARYCLCKNCKNNLRLRIISLSWESFHLQYQTSVMLVILYHLYPIRGLDDSNLYFKDFWFGLKWINLLNAIPFSKLI